ncbi:hypothetical protein QJS04_geneDACA009949 [Acorus gramineus]|uniref:Uncharacterized protein n=1 Tax=Acorus gramineus TaxID=55184 RepID=A0AAV9BFT8_ACOGR|nr:hypothetical protein QJS04_geneDACA009949 [Acorus gramineus]
MTDGIAIYSTVELEFGKADAGDRAVTSTPSNRETVDRPGRPDGTLKDECLDVDEEITYAIDDLVSDVM